MAIAENLADIKNRIAGAAKRCGRDPASIKLIAVSKTKPVEQILEAVSAGQLAFGENYAQELRDKAKQVAELLRSHDLTISRSHEIEWHFIGHLQKNKIKYVLPAASWIHTIDSAELLEAINRYLTAHPELVEGRDVHASTGSARTIHCLIEVNIAGESAKSGVSPENVFELVKVFSETYQLANLPTCKLMGLMCMPPYSSDPETSRPYFKKLKNLLDEINSRSIYPEKLIEFSMGMTQDFDVAIEEGATMVRVGTAIFGERGM